RTAFSEQDDPDALPTKAIIAALVAMEERPWATWGKTDTPITPHALARRLAEFEVLPAGELWLAGKNVRGYRRAAFEDAWLRYCAQESLEREKPNKGGLESATAPNARRETLADGESGGFANSDAVPSALA